MNDGEQDWETLKWEELPEDKAKNIDVAVDPANAAAGQSRHEAARDTDSKCRGSKSCACPC